MLNTFYPILHVLPLPSHTQNPVFYSQNLLLYPSIMNIYF